jgi:hypothetical protein
MPRFGRAFPMPIIRRKPKLFPAFDSASAGNTSSSSPTSLADSSITIAGNCVITAVMTYVGQSPTCAVGSTPMNAIGGVFNNNASGNGGIQLFSLKNSGLTGPQTVTATWTTAPTYAAICTLSFFNVTNVGAGVSQFGNNANTQNLLAVSTTFNAIVVGCACATSIANPPMSSFFQPTLKYTSVLGGYIEMLLGYSVSTGFNMNVGATTSPSGSNYSLYGFSLT